MSSIPALPAGTQIGIAIMVTTATRIATGPARIQRVAVGWRRRLRAAASGEGRRLRS